MSQLSTCINCHNSFSTEPFRCYRCSEGQWCSYYCKTNDSVHPSWCQLIRQSERDDYHDSDLESSDEEENEKSQTIHKCHWLFRTNNNHARWECWCGEISIREPNKPWDLLGGLKPEWSIHFKIAAQQKVDDMNEFIYFDSCKKEKPCNCINCLCVWDFDTLGISKQYLE